MYSDPFRDTADSLERRRRRVWQKIVTALSCVVVFCTTYALILPALTLEKTPTCEKQEHTHTESCYTQVASVLKTVPICTLEDLAIHRHSDDCLDGNGQLCCGEADFVVHMHDQRCYDENGHLWCPIPQKETHNHSESCYEIPETHVHGEACYQKERGELICAESEEPVHTHGEGCYAPEKKLICTLQETEGHAHGEGCYGKASTLICTQTETPEHWHSDGCYEKSRTLTCTLTEGEGHQHGEGCYDESGALTCTLTEAEGHQHGDGCYEDTSTLTCALTEGEGHQHGEGCYAVSSTLTCAQTESEGHTHGESCYESVLTCTESTEPAHVHTDECYAWNEVLTCTQPTDPAEPVLTCGKEEVVLHRHTQEGCYVTDAGGSLCLTCDQTQILEHIHTDDCFQTVEEPSDPEVLTCQLEESEDHQHTALCYGTWELSCPLEEHTHTESCDPQAAETPQKELICTEEHTHTESCDPQAAEDPQKELVCTEEHTHTEDCYQAVEAPADPEAPYCQLEESEDHQHSALCYGIQPLGVDPTEPSGSTEGTDPTGPSTPSDPPSNLPSLPALDRYITGATLSYRVSPDTNWNQVGADTTLPGNAELKLDISYGNLLVSDLRKVDLQVTYALPKILRNPTGSGTISDTSGVQMGTMTLENGVVKLNFDETWLDNHHSASSNDAISGNFHVQSQIDLTEAGKNPSTEILVGGVTIGLKFDPNIIAKHAEVTIQKSDPVAIHVEKSDPVADPDNSGDYLEYTLTVTAGRDGAPDVEVKDSFTDKSNILGYVGIPAESPAVSGAPVETGAPAGKAGQVSIDSATQNMKWTIGDMAANETRTLTYRVKLKEGYLGGGAKTNSPIVNNAELWCGAEKRKEDAGNFTPQAGATMSKVVGQYTPGSDGGGTITYTIWIQALATNNYTLTNVKVFDALDGSIENKNATLSKYLPYLSINTGSFRLYKGGSKDQNGAGQLELLEQNPHVTVLPGKTGETQKNHYVCCDAGTLAPGESKTLTYTVQVEPGVFPAAGNDKPAINNRAQIHAGDSSLGNEASLNSYSKGVSIQEKVWCSKQSGIKQTEEFTVEIPSTDAVYAANNSPVQNHPSGFVVPAGSYLYQVTVNDAGDWDVSKAVLKDQLLGDRSKYVGYVKVDAINVDTSGNRTPDKTVWLAVDQLKEFTFTPSSVGLAEKAQAYVLTYYTSVNIGGAPQVTVKNKFNMTGKVGLGDVDYTLAGAYVEVSNFVQGSNGFSVSKYSWYYEPAKEGNYPKGAIYWYIQVDGTEIPADTCLQDLTSYVPHSIYDDSLVGLYTGNMGDRPISSYDDFDDLMASNKLTRLPESNYDTPAISFYREGGDEFPTMTVRLKNSIQLSDGESLFLIIKTEPSSDPADLTGTGFNTYQNKVKSSYNGTDWDEWESLPTMVLYGSNGISKTLEKVFSKNGSTETVIEPEGEPAPPVFSLDDLANGTYASWNIQLNYTGRLHGDYYVEELIPEGMELVYVQCTGVGSGYPADNKPSCVQKDLGADWTPHQRAGTLTTYYYTNGRIAHWYVNGLQTGGNDHTVDFRVVCRVTDLKVLLEGENKTFENQVNLCREGGKLIDSSSNPVTLQFQSLSKTGPYDPEVHGASFPFIITVNPEGVDMVPGADTITLVDTLSNTLRLDLSSIHVKRSGTETEAEGWNSSVKGQTLTLTLPDGVPLTVTYSAWINAKPGEHISISNDAHWEGHPTPSGAAVENDDFAFSINASAGTTEKPSIEITKRDENDLSKFLDAEFTLTEAEVQADGITIVEKDDPAFSWTERTGADGILTFGFASGQNMKYNTVYCLRETQAPVGYVLDGTRHYFVIAQMVTKEDGTKDYPPLLNNLPTNVYVHYLGSEYFYQALNRKGQITVQKTFKDPSGETCGPIAGTYQFGLYTQDGDAWKPVENTPTVTITYSNEDTNADKTAVFRDLPLNQSYYVFELDAHNNPILDGSSSGLFTVTYDYSGDATCASLTSENGDQTVTVTNQCVPELPQTGGMGVTVFYGVGLLLLAGAAVLLLKKKRVSAGTW